MGAKFNIITDSTTDATSTASIPLYSSYKDYYYHQINPIPLSGGAAATDLLLTFPSARKPDFGAGELIGYKLGVFVNYIEYGNEYTSPIYKVYKVKDPVLKEGTFGNLTTKDILTYGMLNNNSVGLVEGFDTAVTRKARRRQAHIQGTTYIPLDWAMSHALWDYYGLLKTTDATTFMDYWGTDVEGRRMVEVEKGYAFRRTEHTAKTVVLNILTLGAHDYYAYAKGSTTAVYKPVKHAEIWIDEPVWSVSGVDSVADYSIDSSDIEEELFTNEGTIFDKYRSGSTRSQDVFGDENAVTEAMLWDERMILSGSDGLHTNSSLTMRSFLHGASPFTSPGQLLHTSNIPNPVPYQREIEDTSQVASTQKYAQSMGTQVTVTAKFNELAPVFSLHKDHRIAKNGYYWDGADTQYDDAGGIENTSLRGFFMVFSEIGPFQNETYHDYIYRLEKRGSLFNSHAIQNTHESANEYSSDNEADFRGRIGYLPYYFDDNTEGYHGRFAQFESTDNPLLVTPEFELQDFRDNSKITHRSWRYHNIGPASYYKFGPDEIGFTKGTYYDFTFTFKGNSGDSFIIITESGNDEIFHVEKIGRNQGTDSKMHDEIMMNHLSIWTTNFPSSQLDAYTGNGMASNSSYAPDMENEVVIDSVTIRGATPSRNNATVVDNNLGGRVSIDGDIAESVIPLMNLKKLSEDWNSSTKTFNSGDYQGHKLSDYSFESDEEDDDGIAKSARIPSYIALGFTADNDIRGDGSGATIPKHILFNDFKVSDASINSAIPDANIRVFTNNASSNAPPLGCQIGHDALGTGVMTSGASSSEFSYRGGNRDIESFTRKGFVTSTWDSHSWTFPNRECIMASTRVIEFTSNNKLMVEDISMLNLPDDEELILFQANTPYSGLHYKSGLKIVDLDIDKGIVKLNKNCNLSEGFYSTGTGDKITFDRRGTAQAVWINVPSGTKDLFDYTISAFDQTGYMRSQRRGGITSIDGCHFQVYDGDNRRHCFYFQRTTEGDPILDVELRPTTLGGVHYFHKVQIECGAADSSSEGYDDIPTDDDVADMIVAYISDSDNGVAYNNFSSYTQYGSIVHIVNRQPGKCDFIERGCDGGANPHPNAPAEGWTRDFWPSERGANVKTDGTTDPDRIIDDDAQFVVEGFAVGDLVQVLVNSGGVSPDFTPGTNNGVYCVSAVTADYLEVETSTKGWEYYQYIYTPWLRQIVQSPALGIDVRSQRMFDQVDVDAEFRVRLRTDENENGYRLFIGPKRRWVIFEVFNFDSDGYVLPNKSYGSFLVGSSALSTHISGPTFNESSYTDSEGYKNRWVVSPSEASIFEWGSGYQEEEENDNYITKWTPQVVDRGSIASKATHVITTDDKWLSVPYNNYGRKFFILDDGTHSGTNSTITAFTDEDTFTVADATNMEPGDSYQISGYNLVNLEGMNEKKDFYDEGELASFYLKVEATDLTKTHIDGFNASPDNPPFFLSIFEDELPEVDDFIVKPNEDNPLFPSYTWVSNDDDLWYGFLIQDYEAISNQYHGSVLYLPLNDTSDRLDDFISDNSYQSIKATRKISGVYSDTTATSGQFSDNYEGLAGHCKKFGTNTFLNFDNTGGAFYDEPINEMSCVVHFTPDDLPSGNEYVVHQDNVFSIYLDSNGNINALVKPHSNGKHSTGSFGTSVVLKSTSIVNLQGQPTNVILTVDVAQPTGNVKLYVDGKLEDQSGKKTSSGGENNWQDNYVLDNKGTLWIGASGSSSGSYPSVVTTGGFDGKIEEFVLYNRLIHPVVPQTGELTVFKPFEELSTGTYASGRSVVARLFIKDYHNIRGENTFEVASTSQVAFKKSGIGLDTYNI